MPRAGDTECGKPKGWEVTVVMDYGYRNGGGHWGMWILMIVAMLVFWGALAWIIVTLLRQRGGHSDPRPVAPSGTSPDALRILDERLARGEIEEEEYKRRRDLIKRNE
jgi:putative membrane protein